jgi:hypothetical protein
MLSIKAYREVFARSAAIRDAVEDHLNAVDEARRRQR